MSQVKLLGSFGPDCIFADCFGFCPFQPCFNDQHDHGNRVDEEWIYHRMFFDDALSYCISNDVVLATEGATDIAGAYCQFLHGNINADFKIQSNSFPQLFCYTFPELINTERNIYSSEGDFEKQLKYSLTMGMRLDAQLWVCRSDISKDPKYAEAIGRYTSLLDSYGNYYFDGRFTVIDTSSLPAGVFRSEWVSDDGDSLLTVLYNSTDKLQVVQGTPIAANDMSFTITPQ